MWDNILNLYKCYLSNQPHLTTKFFSYEKSPAPDPGYAGVTFCPC